MRRLIYLVAALAVVGCAAKQPQIPAPLPPPAAPEIIQSKPPRPKPAAPAATPMRANPSESCNSLALQRANDARSLGQDAGRQRKVRDETFADCMASEKRAQ